MLKIWAKVMLEQKIVKHFVYEKQEQFKDKSFHNYLMDICKEIDLETPIVLKKHLSFFKEFRSVKFIKDDFLEEINFDALILENISI